MLRHRTINGHTDMVTSFVVRIGVRRSDAHASPTRLTGWRKLWNANQNCESNATRFDVVRVAC